VTSITGTEEFGAELHHVRQIAKSDRRFLAL
jgi:hypothetical protein